MAVRVLTVNDSVFARDSLRPHLERLGCEVVAEAENTTQVLDLFRTVRPSLVTVAVTLPSADHDRVGAVRLIRLIRGQDCTVPILAVSAISLRESRGTLADETLSRCAAAKPGNGLGYKDICEKLGQLFPELKVAGHSPASPRPTLAAQASLPSRLMDDCAIANGA